MYPSQFGNDLLLTPHTYILSGATVFTNSLYLDAQNNANAVFVIKICGALSSSTYAKVILLNGAQAKNVYWIVNGAVDINDYSEFSGTIVCNNGAANVSTGAIIEGRLLTTSGALTSSAVTVNMTPGCTNLGIGDVENSNKSIKLYPNPFAETLTIQVEETNISSIFTIYDVMGKEVMRKTLLKW